MKKNKADLTDEKTLQDTTHLDGDKTVKITLYCTLEEWGRYCGYCAGNKYEPLPYLKDRLRYG